MEARKSKSLFDDIFRLQNTAPDDDIDPEDPEDGLKAQLVDAAVDEAECLGPSKLRKQTAIISNDPRYKGRKTARTDLYSDEEDDEGQSMDSSGDEEDFGRLDDDNIDEESEDDDEEEKDDEKESGLDDDQVRYEEENVEKKDNIKILSENKSNDRKKGKAVVHQLGVWDDLIKGRIVLQKIVTACNRLPQPDVWPDFWDNASFRQEARNVHSSVRKFISAIIELQSVLASDNAASDKKGKKIAEDSDEEVTSESEAEGAEESSSAKQNGFSKTDDADDGDDTEDEDEIKGEEGKMKADQPGDEHDHDSMTILSQRARLKRKLSAENMEETLAKKHADFQSYRNDTLSKWDEKTRLVHGKIKSKNFAAFEMSVLKQIEQVLVNRDRLIRRIHQKRSEYRILGKPQLDDMLEKNRSVEVEDDDDDVEMKLKQQPRSEISIDPEIIDDNDFYHMCLRDFIETKQNDETDPVLANKQWLEIQRLRNKQKQKVDTRASKGRKIRYNIKEKLKNYMTPYDKSLWSEEQKDDLFKALFGGRSSQDNAEKTELGIGQEKSSIILGI